MAIIPHWLDRARSRTVNIRFLWLLTVRAHGQYNHRIQTVYDSFLAVIQYYLSLCIPVKSVRVGLKDCDYVTALIRSLLNKRNRMHKQGNVVGADLVA